MERVEVNLNGVKSNANFEVIEIVYETNMYSTLLGTDWAFDNSAILNFMNNKMSFELNAVRLVAPLDPQEGERYNKLVKDDVEIKEIDNLYNITTRRKTMPTLLQMRS